MNKYAYSGIFTLAFMLTACGGNDITIKQNSTPTEYPIIKDDDSKEVVGTYIVPDDADIDKQSNAAQIRYGQRLLNHTKRLLPDNVGDEVNCNSCHIDQGKTPGGNPYINTYNNYPRVMPRPGKEIDLVGRINGCFKRSMNGKPLPPDSEAMQAMIAYMKWLGQDVPKGERVDISNAIKINTDLIPDPERGKQLYAQQCATCHGINGEGKRDGTGQMAFPPLWGEHSFNIGAGMARTYKAAAFIKAAMPMGVQTHGAWGEGGVLSEQDAVDIAEYFSHQPRPDFAGKDKDWPNGRKPKDARY